MHTAIGLKTPDEGVNIRHRLEGMLSGRLKDSADSLPHVTVVGGGYTGFEAAAHAADQARRLAGCGFDTLSEHCRILIIEKSDTVLRNCSKPVRQWAVRLIQRMGVALHTNMTAEPTDEPATIRLSDGSLLRNAILIWCAGVSPGKACRSMNAAAEPSGRLRVDEFLRLPKTDHVFVAGDAAAPRVGTAAPLRMSIQFSRVAGTRAAENLLRVSAGRQPISFRPLDPGYIVPLTPGEAAGNIIGHEFVGRAPSWLHYAMCMIRSWGWEQRHALWDDLLRCG
jgi:NADH dehydrogenase FAD-containing subunit